MKLKFFSVEGHWPVFVKIDKQLYYNMDDKYYCLKTGSQSSGCIPVWKIIHPITIHDKKTINTKLLFLIYGEKFFTSLKEAINGRKG